MSPFILLLGISEYLKPRLELTPLAFRSREPKTPRGTENRRREMDETRPARIFIGSMPPTEQEAASAAPFVVIQAMDGEDDGGLQTVRVAIRVCVAAGCDRDDCEAAENDLLNLVSQIRLWLLETDTVASGRFRMIPYGENGAKLPWERPDEQVYPFLQAHIFSQWQTAGARRVPTEGMEDYE